MSEWVWVWVSVALCVSVAAGVCLGVGVVRQVWMGERVAGWVGWWL